MNLVIEALRGEHVESVHPISAVLVEPSGRVVDQLGPPITTTWRSAAKPFQLEVALELLPEVETLSGAEIAVGASSHHGQELHLACVRGLLRRYGCGEDDLFCGAHPPVDEASAHALIRAGIEPSVLHNNCSGKHAFMAAASRYLAAPRDYRSPEHPLQQRITKRIRERTGVRPELVIDGCGVPCFVLPLVGMARAWATLAAQMVAGDEILGRIGRCMRVAWWHASGRNAIDGALIREATRPLVAKVGAEGLICLALPDQGLGVAVKSATGSDAARQVAVIAVLEHWFPGLLPAGFGAEWLRIRNWVGTECGQWRPRFC